MSITTEVNVTRLAQMALYRYVLTTRAAGTTYAPDRKAWTRTNHIAAAARFNGFAEALATIGFGMAPAAIELDVIEAWRETIATHGPRPSWSPMNNDDMVTWDEAATTALARRWSS